MFKTVSFNIFEENLQDIVYGENFAGRAEKDAPAKRDRGMTIQKITEIVIKPLVEKSADRKRETI